MKVYFNNKGNINYIDCTSEEFSEIYNKKSNTDSVWVDLSQLPKCFGETIQERMATYIGLRKLVAQML